jgi:hypothetical protein
MGARRPIYQREDEANVGPVEGHGWLGTPRGPNVLGGPFGSTGGLSRLAGNGPAGSAEVPIATLKVKATSAIPVVRARVQAWSSGNGAPDSWAGTLNYGADARERNTIYSTLWHQLEPNNGRFWFQAAAMVTGRGGIKSMEGGLSALGVRLNPKVPVRVSDTTFLIEGNKFLFPFNLSNFYTLHDHHSVPGFPHFWGRELDRALVVVEQTLVQTFIDSFGWQTPTEKPAAIDRISRAFTSFGANEWVMRVLAKSFSSSRPFNFGSLDHRIELGIAIVDELRAA